ncbi:MAG: ankyrin repeat domain-containing protein [Kiritimatiellae bacterium]|nr:ankyrin repeat domain-containing protein [Kiritimatiellia bacterium]
MALTLTNRLVLVVVIFFVLHRTGWPGEIHDAIEAQNIAKVRSLLASNKAMAAEPDKNGAMPLHLAARLNNAIILNLLVDAGARVDVLTANGRTALQVAVDNGSFNAVSTIVKKTNAVYLDRFLDARTARGASALKSGRSAKAYELFTRLLKEDPGNEKVSFGHGLLCVSLDDFSLARMDFERVLMINDNNLRARAELGRVHLAMGQRKLAKECFRDVLAANPSEDVRCVIEQYLKTVKKQSGEWLLSARIDAGYLDDSNVNIGPDSSIISIWPIILGSELIDSLTIKDSSKPLGADGPFLSLTGSASYDCGKPGGWSGMGAASYYQNRLDDAPDKESSFGQIMAGMKKAGRRDVLLLPLKIAHITTGDDPLINIYGINPSYIRGSGHSGAMMWQTSLLVESRDYDELDDRDSTYFLIAETMKQSFGDGKHSIFMGLNFFHDHTDAASYENTGNTWLMGAEFGLAWGFTLYARGRHVSTDYKQRETLAPEKRSDTQNRVTIGLGKKITNRWSINLNYQKTDNSSTFGLYHYTRDVTTISTSLKF